MSAAASAGIHRSRPRREQESERPTLTPEQEWWRKAYPAEFKDGAKLGFSGRAAGPRERGMYPLGFLDWNAQQWDAWFCGWSAGYVVRKRK
jgi:hypothetical protein